MNGLLAAAQDDRVAALEAQRRGIRRYVRTRFVYHGDYADGHGNLFQQDAAGKLAALERHAQRIGQRIDVEHAVRHARDALFGQRKAIEHCVGKSGFFAGGEIERVLLEDGGFAVQQRAGAGGKRGVARIGGGYGQKPCGALRLFPHFNQIHLKSFPARKCVPTSAPSIRS